ncbi:MAG: phosphatase PAP2 family protein [Bacteroidota bacterium]|nr:phosphatase PAP2 family protein [Bacteroidota bacterium]
MKFKKWFSALTAADAATVFFLAILSVVNLIFSSRVEQWAGLILLNCALALGSIFVANRSQHSPSIQLRLVHDWYLLPMILFVFKETYWMVHPIHPHDYDSFLINIDHILFGVNPTQWLEQWASPLVTEILQISYASYYFILVTIFIELYVEKRYTDFYSGGFFIVYGFYLSYIGYFLLPAVGPRFTLYNFNSLNYDLPGIFLTNFLRDFVNTGESIPKGAADVVQFAQRDVFPSGHTQLTLVSLYLAFHFRLRTRWVLLIVGVLLIVSTVYLRYHYGVDVLAGVLFFLFTIWSAKKLERWWEVQREQQRREKLRN